MSVPDYSATPEGESYAAAWGLAHERFAAEDAARSAWLDARAYDRPRYSGNAPSPADTVREVRRLLADGVSQCEIARRLNLGRSTVCKIANGKRHREVE